jgi:hypothetical protein
MKPYFRPRNIVNLSESIDQRLNMYALVASAAGVTMLALAQHAEARIVYTPAHVVIHRGWPGILPLDLNHDGTADFKIENWWNSDPDGNVGFLSVLPARAANGVWGYSTGLGLAFWASALHSGVKVGPKGPFFSPKSVWMDNTLGGPWNDVWNRYLGLKFKIKGKTHFGWARLSVSRNDQNYKITATLTGYAYETIPNKPIVAGKTHGRASLGALAAGSAALSSR